MTTRPFLLAGLGCLALAAASLLVAREPAYDAWAWLVWGRELAGLELDITGGPSWKPLPVALATGLSAAGDAAPALWLVLVRTAWLLSLVLAAELAGHLAPAGASRRARLAGAAFAAISLALLADAITPWSRQAAAGLSEPLLVALVLAAVRAALGGRTRLALVLGGLAALVRPEVWPLLAAYGLCCWRAEPRTRPLLVAVAVAVPALWFGPDLLAAGDALTGAERARQGNRGPLVALGRAVALPLAVAWPLALVAVLGRDRERDRRMLALGAGALAWVLLVVAMTPAGFAGLPRFATPAAALVGVLAGAGLARLLSARQGTTLLRAVPAIVALAIVVQLPGRLPGLAQGWRSTASIGASHDRLRALVREAIPRAPIDVPARCGLSTSDTLVRPALAWELELPFSQVVKARAVPVAPRVMVTGPQATPALRAALRARARLLATRGEWSAYSLGCSLTLAASSPSSPGRVGAARSAGVSGARR